MSAPRNGLFPDKMPNSWTVVRLDDVTEIAPRMSVEELDEDSLVHFVPMAAVSEDFAGVDTTQLRPLRDVRKGYTAFVAGDVLLAKITPCMENGKGGLVPKLAKTVAFGSTEFHVLRASAAVANSWLAQYLSQPAFRRLARANMTGTAGQMRVPTKWLCTVEIPVPPKAEQFHIVEKLEELLSDLDAGVAELKAAQKKLAQYRQSLLKAAVEGALTAEWREKHKPAETGAQLLGRILTERRVRWEARQLAKFKEQRKLPPLDWQKKYPEPMQPDTTGLPVLPQGWVWASLEQISEIQGGIQKQPSRAPLENKYPFLRVANVARGKLKLQDVHEIELFPGELERLTLIAGDILIVEGNGSLTEIGRCALWDGSIVNAVHQNHLIRVRPIGVVNQFIESWLNSLGGIDKLTSLAATTSGLYTLSVGKLSKIPVPIAPRMEQEESMRILVDSVFALESQAESVELSLKQSTAQRQNILRAAFAGQLVPQDPADEPASALLARIRAERAARGARIPSQRSRRSASTKART